MKKELKPKAEIEQNNTKEEAREERREARAERREVREYRHRDSGGIVWGVMFIFAGIIFLFNNLGVIPWSVWNTLWQFWPLLLVFAGINIILGEGMMTSLILGVLAIAAFGSIFAFALKESGSPLFSLWGFDKIPWLNIFNNLKLK